MMSVIILLQSIYSVGWTLSPLRGSEPTAMSPSEQTKIFLFLVSFFDIFQGKNIYIQPLYVYIIIFIFYKTFLAGQKNNINSWPFFLYDLFSGSFRVKFYYLFFTIKLYCKNIVFLHISASFCIKTFISLRKNIFTI